MKRMTVVHLAVPIYRSIHIQTNTMAAELADQLRTKLENRRFSKVGTADNVWFYEPTHSHVVYVVATISISDESDETQEVISISHFDRDMSYKARLLHHGSQHVGHLPRSSDDRVYSHREPYDDK